ncbi:MAG: hypothetical protein ACYDEJ_03465 [Desulfitobacteriaceae bacterium]
MKYTGLLSGKVHCEYCQCPIEVWDDNEPPLKTYSGDGCKLFDSFSSLAEWKLSAAELIEIATRELPKEFPDIADIDATVKELMDIILECGILDNPYPDQKS